MVEVTVAVVVVVAVLSLEADELESAVDTGVDVLAAADADDGASVLLPVLVLSLAPADVTLPSADCTAPAAVASPANPEYVCR